MFFHDEDKYIFRRSFENRAHPDSLFTIEVLPGLFAQFGEPRSKLHSKKYYLVEISFIKNIYSSMMAAFFWKKFSIQYIYVKRKGKRLPPIHRVLGSPQRLIHDGYVVICEKVPIERETFLFQHSYEYWLNQFELNGDIHNDPNTCNEAIRVLINKVGSYPTILHDIPTTDWRIFEELVAEVFRKFGYEIDLTKKTRDGGKDIIALRKNNGITVEKLLIECKHWKNQIDVDPVRNLIGVATTEEQLPTGIILATTSTFTTAAQKISINSKILIELSLKDYKAVLEWIGDYNAIQLTSEEVNSYFQ